MHIPCILLLASCGQLCSLPNLANPFWSPPGVIVLHWGFFFSFYYSWDSHFQSCITVPYSTVTLISIIPSRLHWLWNFSMLYLAALVEKSMHGANWKGPGLQIPVFIAKAPNLMHMIVHLHSIAPMGYGKLQRMSLYWQIWMKQGKSDTLAAKHAAISHIQMQWNCKVNDQVLYLLLRTHHLECTRLCCTICNSLSSQQCTCILLMSGITCPSALWFSFYPKTQSLLEAGKWAIVLVMSASSIKHLVGQIFESLTEKIVWHVTRQRIIWRQVFRPFLSQIAAYTLWLPLPCRRMMCWRGWRIFAKGHLSY